MRRIIVLATVLRLLFVTKHEIWFDEKASTFVSGLPFTGLFIAAAQDTHPPFYFILLKIWSFISTDVLFLRLLSLLIGVAGVAIAYKIFQKLSGQKIAELASLFFALSPLHIYYSTEIRMYSLLSLLTLTSVWFYLKFAVSRKKSLILLITLTSIAALFTHYYAALTVLSLNVLFFISRKKKFQLKPWLASQAAIVLSFLPWILFAAKFPKPPCWCFNPIIGVPATLASFTVGGMGIVTLRDYLFESPKLLLPLFVLATTFMSLMFLYGLRRKKSVLIFFLVPVISATFLGLFKPFYSPRGLIIVSPFFYLIASLGIYSFKTESIRFKLRLIALALLTLILTAQYSHPFFSKLPSTKEYLQISDHFLPLR